MNYNYYRWYVVNNQETSHLSIVELVPGWFESETDVIDHLEGKYNFGEKLFGVRKITESETPLHILGKSRM